MKKIAARIAHIGLAPLRKFKTLSLKKKAIVIVALVILLFIVSGMISNANTKPGYSSAVVKKGNIVEVVTETGSITTSGRTDIYSPTNGIVQNVLVRNGESVTEGQELFTVESSATAQEQSTAYANYLTAVASLNAARSNENALRSEMYAQWDTFRNLATNDTYETSDGNPNEHERESAEFQIAQDQWKATEAKYKDQQTVVSQAEAQVSATWLAYQATQNATVTAPISGTISNLSVSIGSSVSVQSPTLPVSPVLAIANVSTTEVVISLSETDIAKVREGNEVLLDVSAVQNKTYKGVVTRVDDIGTDTQGVIRYNIYIEIIDADERLRPGMTVDADITTQELEDVLSVPNSAVKPYQGGRAVRVFDEETNEITYLPVEIGIRGESNTQILKGLEEGQEVVTSLSNDQLQRPGLFAM